MREDARRAKARPVQVFRPDELERMLTVLDAPAATGFVALTKLGKVWRQRARAFVGADLRGIDFGTDDLSGFSFRNADLRGANLLCARDLGPEMFIGARVDVTTLAPPGLFGPAKPGWARRVGRDQFGVYADLVVGAVTQRLRFVPPGSFMMGAPKGSRGPYDVERPQHAVTFTIGFWLFDTPCTQALWEVVMGKNSSRFQDPKRPVENVSFQDATRFIETLNARMQGLNLSLPSESQWEYACRVGTTTHNYGGGRSKVVLQRIAWYADNSDGETHKVGEKSPNDWGLHDMLGNVWEWCADEWHDSYDGAPADGSAWVGPPRGGAAHRVVRGGSWFDEARDVRAACRNEDDPADRHGNLGFRCARVQA